MIENLFVFGLAVLCGSYLAWGFRVLPRARWQILASIPSAPDGSGGWHGLNLTWYGVLSATANLLGTALALVLLASLGLPIVAAMAIAGLTLAVSVPAARWLARVVERRRSTFTVAGASLIGFTLAPWIIWLHLRLLPGRPSEATLLAIPACASLAAGYALGEGFGRLACISFGCCYVMLLDTRPPGGRRLFERGPLVFESPIKKACYEGGLAGRGTFPIQALTALVCVGLGLLATALVLHACCVTAYLTAVIGSQIWRFVSEVFRADYRGGGLISAYQRMALFSSAYALVIAAVLPVGQPSPQLVDGLRAMWHPGVLLGLQGLWITIVWYMGRSTVTASRLTFYLVQDSRRAV